MDSSNENLKVDEHEPQNQGWKIQRTNENQCSIDERRTYLLK